MTPEHKLMMLVHWPMGLCYAKQEASLWQYFPLTTTKELLLSTKNAAKRGKVCQTLMLEDAISVLLLVEAAGDCGTRGAVSVNVTLQEPTGAAIQVLPFLLINLDLQQLSEIIARHRRPLPESEVWISAQWVDVGLYSRDLP